MMIIKKNKTLFLAFVLYLGIALFMPHRIGEVFDNSLYYFKELFEVIPLILLLTAMIDAWIPQALIGNKLGADAGFKGYFFSLIIGSVSAGPIYAAFPVTKMLYKKGASLSNITVILSAWAVVKLPMLINEAKFLGFNYMMTRWIITIIAIMIMGTIVGKIVKREDVEKSIKSHDETGVLAVNESYCIGCGLCVKMAPEYFKMVHKKAVLNHDHEFILEDLKDVIEKCPAKAITS